MHYHWLLFLFISSLKLPLLKSLIIFAFFRFHYFVIISVQVYVIHLDVAAK